jgi:hypothetical protein
MEPKKLAYQLDLTSPFKLQTSNENQLRRMRKNLNILVVSLTFFSCILNNAQQRDNPVLIC